MGPACAVVRFAGRQGKGLLDQGNVQVQEEGAVEDEEAAAAALGVAGELEAADGQVSMALPLNLRSDERGQRGLVSFENKLVGGGDAVERACVVETQHQRIVQDAWPLQDGPAPRGAA